MAGEMRALVPTSEQYVGVPRLSGQPAPRRRHGRMTVLDYAMMVEDSHVKTRLVEYRLRGPDSAINGRGAGPAAGRGAHRRAE